MRLNIRAKLLSNREITSPIIKTGYIGIYEKDSRFPDKGFDGVLWVQRRVFQALLGWYEYEKDERVLKAIESTVHKTIDHYRNTTYFGREEGDGGVAHEYINARRR